MLQSQKFIEKNREKFLDELILLLKIPSVSADPKFTVEVNKCAEMIALSLKNIGIEKVEICPTAGFPIVYGEKIINPSLPTVLVYGHYDVQPADPIELWISPPFEPQIKQTETHPQGAIFARGACDDKGQM
ncbi:MAG: M20/M25/M40 family metallo-hydrolase, partial [Crocinitomicaceae bacterium]|nr:M20/M25/M40 family metallo-hydrolase [Crocinitomicaceae bacterium]